MALPPSVPTSFVPHPGSAATRHRADFTGAFAFIGYGILALVVALAIGAFVYSRVLATEQARKDQDLANQVASIDPATVTKFTNLRDRLSYGLTLLNQHIAMTGFWSDLIAVVPSGVSFSSMHLSEDSTGQVKLEAAGIAKSFNTLAAASDAFATDGRIKDAIFSGITVTGNAVSFALAATIDPSLVAFSPNTSAATTSASAPPPTQP